MGKQQLSPTAAVVIVILVVVIIAAVGYFMFLRPQAEKPLGKEAPKGEDMMKAMKGGMKGTISGGGAPPAGGTQ